MAPSKKKKPKFQLANSSQHDELEDVTGKVKVMVRAVNEHGTWLKGNITKTFTIPSAKVSDVADAIQAALFE